jgi:tRNA-specific 2-thiouridylase
VYVTTDLSDQNLWHQEVDLEDPHWINERPNPNTEHVARLRYRGPLVACTIKDNKILLKDEQRGIAAGQSAVVYDGDRCLGGGIISGI